jgi:ADP-heptose:LPS heptosyltransferase
MSSSIASILAPEQAARLLAARRPVVHLTDGLGDQYMHLPAIRALSRLFEGRLAVHCAPELAALLYPDIALRATWQLRTDDAGWRLPDELGACDLFLSMNDWDAPEHDALVRGLAPAATLGYDDCCEHVLPREFARSNFEVAFAIPSALDPTLRLDDFAWPFALPESARRVARELRAMLPSGARVLAVHAETASIKNLPIEAWRRVIATFLARRPSWYVVLLGCANPGLDRIEAHAERAIPYQGLELASSIALLGEADLFCGIDSSMLHAADLLRVPGVGLFGISDPLRWGFRFTRHVEISAPGRDLATLEPLAVVAAVEGLAEGIEEDQTWK